MYLLGEEAMNRAVEGQYRYYRLYGLLEEMLERTGLVFSDIMKDYEIPDAEPYIRRLENCTTLNQLKLVWADYVSVSCELCQRQKDGMGSRPVRMIKEYIGEHYSENITLNDIADIVFLNPAYLSAMFKKETGQAYTAYLTQVRLDKAVELLNKTDDKTYVIAAKVGYQEQNYFSYVFKKRFGVSPTKFRGVK